MRPGIRNGLRVVAIAVTAIPLMLRPATVGAASAPRLPVCGTTPLLGRPLSPMVLRVGQRPVATTASDRSGHTFVALSGQRGNGSATTLGCRSSVMTIDTASGRLLRTAPIGVIPGAIAADDPDGRVFVAGMDERTFPRDDTPELTILNTRGEVVKASTPFSPCPCAGSAMSLPSIAVDSAVHRVYVVLLESIVTFDATTGAPLGVVAANVFGAEGTPAYAIDTVHHRVFAATGTGVAVIDGRTGVLIRTIRLGDSERALAVDGQTDRLFVAENAGCPSGRPSSARGGVAVFDGSTGQPITHVLRSCVSPMILMDQPARRLLVQLPNGYSRWIKYGVLDTATGRLLRTITMATGPGVFAAVEPGTGRIYYVAGGAVRVLDPRDWKLGRKIILPPGTVGAVTIAVRLHRLLVTDPSHGTVTILPAAPPPAG